MRGKKRGKKGRKLSGKKRRGKKAIGKRNKKTKKQKKMTPNSNSMMEGLGLTIEEIRDYRWAQNQKRKALRVQGWFSLLEKKVDKSRECFLEGAEFFKDCPESLKIYEHLR